MKYNEKTINAFVQYAKRSDIMDAAKIGKTKYYELKHDREFMLAVSKRRTEIVQTTVMMMEQNMVENSERMQSIIREPCEKAQIVLNGLQLFFNVYKELKTTGEIMTRLDALEEALNDKNGTFRG